LRGANIEHGSVGQFGDKCPRFSTPKGPREKGLAVKPQRNQAAFAEPAQELASLDELLAFYGETPSATTPAGLNRNRENDGGVLREAIRGHNCVKAAREITPT
jgi:hypothetical protein